MNLHFITYSATGNIIGVAYYPGLFDIQKFIDNIDLRKNLKALAITNNCDSVMILVRTQDISTLKMVVFEPNCDNLGTFSTMCGNGVRAIAEYVQEYFGFSSWPLSLITQSGILEIEKISDNSYQVLMGSIVTNKSALCSYVNPQYFLENSELIDVQIPKNLLQKLNTLPFSSRGSVCSIGFSTSENDIAKADGEPHMMIELKKSLVKTLEDLRDVAEKYGSIICNNRNIFPLGININFVISDEKNCGSFLVTTFERNLGDDPKKSVTQACGTGCTFVGSEQIRKSKFNRAVINCIGGELIVEKNNNLFYLSGKVIRI